MEEDQEAVVPPLPPRQSMLEWVGLSNQTIAAATTSSSGSRAIGRETVKMMESTRRLGAQEF